MEFKPEIRIQDRAKIHTWLADSGIWMATAVELDRRSGRGRRHAVCDSAELNVAHVCTGFAFELALKALTLSERRSIVTNHAAEKSCRNLGKESRATLKTFVEENEKLPTTIENLLEYLDQRMCHPDRKYWMVARTGAMGGNSFAQNVPGLVIPDLAVLHDKIVDMAGEKTFDGWQQGAFTRIRRTSAGWRPAR